MTLADTVGAICAYLNLPDGATTSTIESKTNFFRGVRSGLVRASAKPLHIGNRTIVVQTDLLDDQDRSVALVIQTQAVLKPGLSTSPVRRQGLLPPRPAAGRLTEEAYDADQVSREDWSACCIGHVRGGSAPSVFSYLRFQQLLPISDGASYNPGFLSCVILSNGETPCRRVTPTPGLKPRVRQRASTGVTAQTRNGSRWPSEIPSPGVPVAGKPWAGT